MGENVWYIDICESPIHCASRYDDIVGHSVIFFAIASLFSEVTIDGHLECGKSSNVHSFSNF